MSNTINFENAIIVVMKAAGTVNESWLGYQECSGHVDLSIMDVDTDEKLGTATIDLETNGMEITGYDGQMIFTILDKDGEELSHTTFNGIDGREGYEKFLSRIADMTKRSKASAKELLANAGEAIGRNTIKHKEVMKWNFGKH
jgi:hypothetical protein